jgi:hypothetical protein
MFLKWRNVLLHTAGTTQAEWEAFSLLGSETKRKSWVCGATNATEFCGLLEAPVDDAFQNCQKKTWLK